MNPDNRVSRRHALGILAVPLTLPLVTACRAAFAPNSGLAPSFTSAAGAVTLIGGGDQHAQATNPAHKTGKLIKAMLDANPAAWAFAIGDLTPHGSAQELLNYDVAWGAFKDRTFFAMGNHERDVDPFANPYYDYVGNRGGPRGKGYYAVTLGAWRCYFLNSEGSSDVQLAWLKADLPRWSKYHIMAMWHSPMFASVCAHNGKAMTLGWKVGPWWQLLQEHGAEFVVCGHVHRWERFPRMLRNGSVSSKGIRQFISGVGGVKPMDNLTVHPKSQRQVVTRGIVRFDLHSDRYEWKFTDLTGVVRDSGREMCRKVVAA